MAALRGLCIVCVFSLTVRTLCGALRLWRVWYVIVGLRSTRTTAKGNIQDYQGIGLRYRRHTMRVIDVCVEEAIVEILGYHEEEDRLNLSRRSRKKNKG